VGTETAGQGEGRGCQGHTGQVGELWEGDGGRPLSQVLGQQLKNLSGTETAGQGEGRGCQGHTGQVGELWEGDGGRPLSQVLGLQLKDLWSCCRTQKTETAAHKTGYRWGMGVRVQVSERDTGRAQEKGG
jgi:hypothetical protein